MCSRDAIRPQPFWQIQRNPKPRESHLTNLTNPTILASFNKSIDGLTLGIRHGPWSDKDMTAKIYSWSGGQNSIHNLRLILWRLVKVKCQAYFVNELMFSVKVCIHTSTIAHSFDEVENHFLLKQWKSGRESVWCNTSFITLESWE